VAATRNSRPSARGATLVEILVALGLVTLLMGGMFAGAGALKRSRLRESTTLLASAVRVAYAHANATSRVTRLVIDFGKRTITMEDTEGRLYLKQDRTGGAAGANDMEKQAIAAGEDLVEGPKHSRPEFKEVRKSGLDQVAEARKSQQDDKEIKTGKELPKDVTFRQVEVQHEDDAVTSEQVYVYFWPGGLAERAAIQVQLGEDAKDGDVMTVTTEPLSGKVVIDNGPVQLRRPDAEESIVD
jgi:general secretion pathway protein H